MPQGKRARRPINTARREPRPPHDVLTQVWQFRRGRRGCSLAAAGSQAAQWPIDMVYDLQEPHIAVDYTA